MTPPTAAENANLVYRVGELERDVEAVSRKVDRLMYAVLSLAISITASAVVFAITVATIREGP